MNNDGVLEGSARFSKHGHVVEVGGVHGDIPAPHLDSAAREGLVGAIGVVRVRANLERV